MYDFFKKKEGITLLHYLAHARPMFYEAQRKDAARAAWYTDFYINAKNGLLLFVTRQNYLGYSCRLT